MNASSLLCNAMAVDRPIGPVYHFLIEQLIFYESEHVAFAVVVKGNKNPI